MASSSYTTCFNAVIALLMLIGITTVSAHSNLGSPVAYSKQSCKADTSCKTPCPPVRGNKQNVATWRRGQNVEIIWHKNNHIGGFYRRSLVPVEHMMDHTWHKRTAFDYGCWSQGTFQCTGGERKCGGDKKGRAYKNRVTIPSVYPNGDYVFAQVWYGGLQWQKKAPKYADYFSCAFVKIVGNEPLASSYTAKFQPNPKPKGGALRGVPMNVCASGSITTNQCGGDACENGPIMNTVPHEFQEGNSQKVSSALFGNEGMTMKPSDVEEAPATVVTDTIQADMQDAKADEQVGEEQTAMEQEPQKSLQTKKSAAPITSSGSGGDYLEEIDVLVGGRKVVAVKDGQSSTVRYTGGSVRLQVVTKGAIKSVVISVSGKGRSTQRSKPYTFVWNSPRMDQETTISVNAITKDGKTASMTAKVTLSRSGNTPTTSSSRSSGSTRSSSGSGSCSEENIPEYPRGSWGRRGSSMFKQKLRMYRQYRKFCRRCRNVC